MKVLKASCLYFQGVAIKQAELIIELSNMLTFIRQNQFHHLIQMKEMIT